MLEFIGFLVISVLGTLSHFLFEITNCNKYSAFFFAVNESTWEHVKIAVFPYFLWMFFELSFFAQKPNFLFAKLVGLLLIIILIPLFYYLYKLILKKDSVIYNIFIFYFSIALAQFVSFIILYLSDCGLVVKYISHLLLIVIFIIFMIGTYAPLKNFIFKDPITKKYGIICKKKK